MALDLARVRREEIRWHLLVVANVSRPGGCYTESMVPVIRAVYPDATEREVRLELDYLEARDLVTIKRDPMDRWFVDLTREGIDLVEYTSVIQPGISRPPLRS
jgi:hypothetical protein